MRLLTKHADENLSCPVKKDPNHYANYIYPFAKPTIDYLEQGIIIHQELFVDNCRMSRKGFLLHRPLTLQSELPSSVSAFQSILNGSVVVDNQDALLLCQEQYNLFKLRPGVYDVHLKKGYTNTFRIEYDADFLARFAHHSPFVKRWMLPCPGTITPGMQHLIREMLYTPITSSIKEGILYHQFGLLLLLAIENATVNSHYYGTDREVSLVNAISAYIDNNLKDLPSVGNIARNYFINEGKLNDLFKKVKGDCMRRYIVARRLERGRALLETTRLSMQEIAEETGYTEQSNFTRQYKNQFGETPLRHRLRK